MQARRVIATRRFSGIGLIVSFALALLVVGCSVDGGGNGSSSTAGTGGSGGNGGIRSTTFVNPPASAATPPVATSGGGPNQPIPPGVPGLTPTKPGQVPAFTGDDMANFLLKNGFPNVGEGGTPTVLQKVFLPDNTVEFLTGYSLGLSPGIQVGYLEVQGNFDFPTPPDAPAIHLPIAYMVFDASNGNIISWGGLRNPSTVPTTNPTPAPTPGQATPTPAAATPTPAANGPTPTPVPQQPTPTPGPPPKLAVKAPRVIGFCANGGWPNKITISNIGGPTLNWSASDTEGITLTPSSGSLGAGASQDITLSGNLAGVSTFPVKITSNGGNATVSIVCE